MINELEHIPKQVVPGFVGLVTDNSEYVLQDHFWSVLLAAAKTSAQAQPAYVVGGKEFMFKQFKPRLIFNIFNSSFSNEYR